MVLWKFCFENCYEIQNEKKSIPEGDFRDFEKIQSWTLVTRHII